MVVARGLVNFKLVIEVNGKTFMLSYDIHTKNFRNIANQFSKIIVIIKSFHLILRNLILSTLKSKVNVNHIESHA